MDAIGAAMFEVSPGTTFRSWALKLSGLLPANLAIPAAHIGLTAARRGLDQLRLVPAQVSAELENWAIPYSTSFHDQRAAPANRNDLTGSKSGERSDGALWPARAGEA